MKQLKAKIIENKKIAQGFYKMRVESAYLAKNSKPGQFVEVRCSDKYEPLLRRPLGVHRILDDGIEILYEIAGKGTELLSKKSKGNDIDIIGPLGNGFNLPRTTNNERQTTILVAGGIGVAPLVALAEEIVRSRESAVSRKKIYALIGAKTKEHILCKKEFKDLGAEVIISTEDGSLGKKGLITEYLKLLLQTPNSQLPTIYACGPAAMLKAVAKIAANHKIPCQVSMEERMACGVGVCLGCPVKVNQLASLPVSRLKQANRQTGKQANYVYKMVCKDGPVFDAEEIAW